MTEEEKIQYTKLFRQNQELYLRNRELEDVIRAGHIMKLEDITEHFMLSTRNYLKDVSVLLQCSEHDPKAIEQLQKILAHLEEVLQQLRRFLR